MHSNPRWFFPPFRRAADAVRDLILPDKPQYAPVVPSDSGEIQGVREIIWIWLLSTLLFLYYFPSGVYK